MKNLKYNPWMQLSNCRSIYNYCCSGSNGSGEHAKMTLDGCATRHLAPDWVWQLDKCRRRRQREPEIGRSDENASTLCCGATYFYSYVMVSLPLLQYVLYVTK
jgi:hypothetical protein